MANLSLLATYPKGLWESLINTFSTGVGSYVWGIILLTIVIKVVLLPFDFLQRYTTSSFSRAQAYLEPEKQKLEKRYAKNPKVLNEALNKLYKSNNVKMGSSCLVIFLSFALNIVVLLTFWNGMTAVSNYHVANQYTQFHEEYQIVYDASIDEGKTVEEATTLGQQAVLEKYDDINVGFLWIKNIWKADSPLVQSVPTFEEWVSLSKTTYETDEAKEAAKTEYNTVMELIFENKKQVNGYFILPILVVALMVFSQYITRKSQMPPKEKLAQMSEEQQKNMKKGKAMMIVLPIIYALFVISTASLFAFYIFISSLISTATTPLITKVVNIMEKKKEEKREKEIAVDYRRK